MYKEVVLEFKEIKRAKSEENMAQIVSKLLYKLDIKCKVLSIISNNASNNKTLIEEINSSLYKKFARSSNTLRFCSQESYIWCLVYVLNLIIKKLLATFRLGNCRLAKALIELVLQNRYLNTTDLVLARLRVLAIWIL